jgi:hypothetical protein
MTSPFALPTDLPAPDDKPEDLVAEAWILVAEALRQGTMTLRSGKQMQLGPEAILKHVQWLAAMRQRRSKSLPVPKDAFLQPTG